MSCSDCGRAASMTCCGAAFCLLHLHCVAPHAQHPSMWKCVDKAEYQRTLARVSELRAGVVASIEADLAREDTKPSPGSGEQQAIPAAAADGAEWKRRFTPHGGNDPTMAPPKRPTTIEAVRRAGIAAARVSAAAEQVRQEGQRLGSGAPVFAAAPAAAYSREDEPREPSGPGGATAAVTEAGEEEEAGSDVDTSASKRRRTTGGGEHTSLWYMLQQRDRGAGGQSAAAAASAAGSRTTEAAAVAAQQLSPGAAAHQTQQQQPAPLLESIDSSAGGDKLRAAVVDVLVNALTQGCARDAATAAARTAAPSAVVPATIDSLALRERSEAGAPGLAAIRTFSIQIESSLFVGAHRETSVAYRDKARALAHALKENGELRARLVAGELAPVVLSSLSTLELAREESRRAQASMAAPPSGDSVGQWLASGLICPGCGSTDTEYEPQMQQRDIRKAEIWGSASSDDARFSLRCRVCGSAWSRDAV